MLLNQIKKDQLEAMENKNTKLSKLLTSLLSKIESIKNNNKNMEISDSEIIQVVNEIMKKNDDLLKESKGNSEKELQFENGVLITYIPVQLSELEIEMAINNIIDEKGYQKHNNYFNQIMEEMNINYSGEYDTNMASKVVAKILSA